MPIYEYSCPQCNPRFELLRPLNKLNETASYPRCHNGAKRVFSSFASFYKRSEEVSTPIGGSSSCSAGFATSCTTCKR